LSLDEAKRLTEKYYPGFCSRKSKATQVHQAEHDVEHLESVTRQAVELG